MSPTERVLVMLMASFLRASKEAPVDSGQRRIAEKEISELSKTLGISEEDQKEHWQEAQRMLKEEEYLSLLREIRRASDEAESLQRQLETVQQKEGSDSQQIKELQLRINSAVNVCHQKRRRFEQMTKPRARKKPRSGGLKWR